MAREGRREGGRTASKEESRRYVHVCTYHGMTGDLCFPPCSFSVPSIAVVATTTVAAAAATAATANGVNRNADGFHRNTDYREMCTASLLFLLDTATHDHPCFLAGLKGPTPVKEEEPILRIMVLSDGNDTKSLMSAHG